MASQKRTGQQKALMLFAILSTISGLITLATTLTVHFASGAWTSIVGEEVIRILDSVWVTSTISGALVFLMGVFSIRAARNDRAAMPAAIIGLIAIAFTFYMQSQTGGGFIQQFEAGTLNPYLVVDVLIVVITSGLAFWVAFDNGKRN